jgi:SAM-dependent methyltransferase
MSVTNATLASESRREWNLSMSAEQVTGHVELNRRYWDDVLAEPFGARARRHWAAGEPIWGMWNIPQSRLAVLPDDVAGRVAVELGCGTGYVSAWLARRGARPIGVDISARQLATARAMQTEFGLYFPLVLADAERVPLRDACADLVISEYGAALWCDPFRWIPEAARLLRPGGLLIFLSGAALLTLCTPEQGPAGDQLVRNLFGLHRVTWPDNDGVEFYLPHGERIRLLRSCGLVVEDLIEVQAPPNTASDFAGRIPLDWARRWPTEEVWSARRL